MGIAGIAVYFTKASCWISQFLYGFLLAVFPMVQSLTVKKVIWLVVWNIFLFSHILGIIIPTDPTDFHILSSYYYPKRPSFCAARLLDADTNGLVDLDEFVTGCLNLHGTAKSPLGRWLGRFPVGIETWGGSSHGKLKREHDDDPYFFFSGSLFSDKCTCFFPNSSKPIEDMLERSI